MTRWKHPYTCSNIQTAPSIQIGSTHERSLPTTATNTYIYYTTLPHTHTSSSSRAVLCIWYKKESAGLKRMFLHPASMAFLLQVLHSRYRCRQRRLVEILAGAQLAHVDSGRVGRTIGSWASDLSDWGWLRPGDWVGPSRCGS